MKPIYLEFSGINSFSERTQIDFRALLKGGLFGIFGDTGSGKSTILDCIHFALYGKIDRAAESVDFINRRCDLAYVSFDFEIVLRGERHAYRVRRELKRAKTPTSKAWLWELRDGKEYALAEGARDVGTELKEIIGLEFADFKMCIALPQGDFAALVKAKPAERVQLVSRLFDLDKYGKRLTDAVNAKYFNACQELEVLDGKMGECKDGTQENIDGITEEITAAQSRFAEAEKEFLQAEKACAEAENLQREKKSYDELKQGLQNLEERLSSMQEKRSIVERLPLANEVVQRADDLQKSENACIKEGKAWAEAKTELQNAENRLAILQRQFEEKDFDGRQMKLTMDLEKVNNAAADVQAVKEAEKRLNDCRAEYKEKVKNYPLEDYDGLIAVAEKRLFALGDDVSLLDYIKRNCKGELLGETYGQVRKDFDSVVEKFPETEEFIKTLAEKYTLVSQGEAFDVTALNAAFKRAEQEKKELKKQISELENKKTAYLLNEQYKAEIKARGERLGKEYETAKEKIKSIETLGSADVITEKLQALKGEKSAAERSIDSTKERISKLLAEANTHEKLSLKYKEECAEREGLLKESLKRNGFSSTEQARSLVDAYGNGNALKETCDEFFKRYETQKGMLEKTDASKFQNFDETAFERARAEKESKHEERSLLIGLIAKHKAEKQRLENLRARYMEFEKIRAEKEKKKNLCEELKKLLSRNRFWEFITAEYLQDVCADASRTLLSLTGGRYFLRYEEEFKVGDNFDGGNFRAVKTLSGGETFLVSLSLALSLSNAICQKSLRPTEFFFLDEGFGTLDEKLVDTVMDVLGKLSKSFSVGLISHVEELKHRIDNKILVTGATETSGSKLKTVCF